MQMTRKDFNRDVEEKVKGLFLRVNDCLAAALMNPLYILHTEINSVSFDAKVKEALMKKLGPLLERK